MVRVMISFMSKRKRYKFQVHLGLEELASVPFVTGVLFAKVRLTDGGGFIDFSSREEIHNNSVQWNSHFEFQCKMTANVDSGVLDPCYVRISVRKEVKGGRTHQKLGYVDLNLAQFAGGGRMSRRCLLEGYDTKHRQDNSTIKVSVELVLISGDPVFKVPSAHAVTQSSSAIGHQIDSSDPRTSDNQSKGSLASNSSLNRRGKMVTSDCGELDAPQDGLAHSRNASYISQHSRGSGTPSSLSSTLERRRKLEESGKEGFVEATRVDAESLINELLQSTNLEPEEADDESGLHFVVQKDGTMAFR